MRLRASWLSAERRGLLHGAAHAGCGWLPERVTGLGRAETSGCAPSCLRAVQASRCSRKATEISSPCQARRWVTRSLGISVTPRKEIPRVVQTVGDLASLDAILDDRPGPTASTASRNKLTNPFRPWFHLSLFLCLCILSSMRLLFL